MAQLQEMDAHEQATQARESEPRTTDCPGLGGHFRASMAYQGSTAHRRMASGRVMMDASSEAAF